MGCLQKSLFFESTHIFYSALTQSKGKNLIQRWLRICGISTMCSMLFYCICKRTPPQKWIYTVEIQDISTVLFV